MSGTSEMETSEPGDEGFATSIVSLFHGPLVKIRLEPSNREYTVSKNLLCAESPVFSDTFEGSFSESKKQTAILQEMEGVVSVRSVEALIQWLYFGNIKFDESFEEICIEAAVELARLAEMYEITRIEDPIARYIKRMYTTTGNIHDEYKEYRRYLELEDEEKILGTVLRDSHPVRRLMAQAFVVSYLRRDAHPNGLMTQKCPKFGADLLYEVKLTLDTLSHYDSATVKDPITGKRRHLKWED
ncbi:hypothetical protein N7471_012610 [Penicillium samsonianum]|uniref:uncharacterized protein n=1 Tax=Penicillium samsonianum TaxID=1882272 RepID=UPI0025473CBF|nr:uncharacterized protein N7471_012610 [Penicillium samsonianum]KAJ6125293.1 hypothetical protein N7471_012610 [Penicillium samsonianum]